MTRDWRAEEAALLAEVAAASEILMHIEAAVLNVCSEAAGSVARYVAEDALDAYQKTKADLAAFNQQRWVNDRSWE